MNSPLRIAPYLYAKPLSRAIPMIQRGRFGQHKEIPTLRGTFDGRDEDTLTGLWHLIKSLEFSHDRQETVRDHGIIVRIELFCVHDKTIGADRIGLIAFNNRAEALFHVPEARFDITNNQDFTVNLLERIGIPPIVIGKIDKKKLVATNYSVIFSRESHQRLKMMGPEMVLPDAPTGEWVCVLVKRVR